MIFIVCFQHLTVDHSCSLVFFSVLFFPSQFALHLCSIIRFMCSLLPTFIHVETSETKENVFFLILRYSQAAVVVSRAPVTLVVPVYSHGAYYVICIASEFEYIQAAKDDWNTLNICACMHEQKNKKERIEANKKETQKTKERNNNKML